MPAVPPSTMANALLSRQIGHKSSNSSDLVPPAPTIVSGIRRSEDFPYREMLLTGFAGAGAGAGAVAAVAGAGAAAATTTADGS